MSDQWLTDAQLARRIGKSQSFVQRRVRDRQWPHLRVGKSIRFTEEHVSQIRALLEVAPLKPAEASASWGRRTRGGT